MNIYFYQEKYKHHVGAAVPGNNIASFEHKSVLECKGLCNADKNCLAIDYATSRDAGSSTGYPSGTCILQSSNAYKDHSKINGYKNLDCYVKGGMFMWYKMLSYSGFQRSYGRHNIYLKFFQSPIV